MYLLFEITSRRSLKSFIVGFVLTSVALTLVLFHFQTIWGAIWVHLQCAQEYKKTSSIYLFRGLCEHK